jgi:hypothetical protein
VRLRAATWADKVAGTLLKEWLAPMGVEEFVAEYVGRRPWARASAAGGAAEALTWQTLDRVLGGADDVLVVNGGRTLPVPAPRTLAEARGLMARGLGFVVRRAERHDEQLAALATAFACDFPGEVHIQLFVTASGTSGFGWHYDFEDVFIVQTAGTKDYYFRDNTVDRHTPRGCQPDFRVVRAETSPLATSRLWPADWLYLPSRWWHAARCVEDSLSMSIGVFPSARTG